MLIDQQDILCKVSGHSSVYCSSELALEDTWVHTNFECSFEPHVSSFTVGLLDFMLIDAHNVLT